MALSRSKLTFSAAEQPSERWDHARAPRRRLGARGRWRPLHRRWVHRDVISCRISRTSSPFHTGGAAAGAARRHVVVDRIGSRTRKCRKTVAAAASTESDGGRGARTGAVRVGVDMVMPVRLVAHVGHGRCKRS